MDKQSEDETNKIGVDEKHLIDIFEAFNKQFCPAISLQYADLLLTTEEIRKKITDHYFVVVSDATLFEILQGMNYRYESLPNKIEFVWMIKHRR